MKCRVCKRPALFRSRDKKGNRRLHGDTQHDLCQRCFRDALNRAHHPPRAELRPFPPLVELEARLLGRAAA